MLRGSIPLSPPGTAANVDFAASLPYRSSAPENNSRKPPRRNYQEE
jgi:hypothetical protein